MRVIHKYTLPVKEKFTMELPGLCRIIRVEDVDGRFYMWGIVDPDSQPIIRYFECYKTGQPIETPADHLVLRGVCKIFIQQELCLYIFENNAPFAQAPR